jgi:hypothetical protein
MAKAKEMVVIEIGGFARKLLRDAIAGEMQKRQIKSYAELGLKEFDLSPKWPLCGEELTLSQLVIIARKLNMQIIITGLAMVGMLEPEENIEWPDEPRKGGDF